MAAPKGNRYWKLRGHNGPKRIFDTPEALFKAACGYFKWCKENPWLKVDYKGTPLRRVEIPTERPYTMKGLCNHLAVNESYFKQLKASMKEKPETTDEDLSTVKSPVIWLEVLEFIDQIISNQQMEGAMVGAFNANIVSRLLGLVDKSATQIDFNAMTDDQLDAMIDKLISKGGHDGQ